MHTITHTLKKHKTEIAPPTLACMHLCFFTHGHSTCTSSWPHGRALSRLGAPSPRQAPVHGEGQGPYLGHPHNHKGLFTSKYSKQVPRQGFHRRRVAALAGQVPQGEHGFVHQAGTVGFQLTWTHRQLLLRSCRELRMRAFIFVFAMLPILQS